MQSCQPIDDAERRIRECRSAEFEIELTTPDGRALPGAECELVLERHEFLLGANAFGLGAFPDDGALRALPPGFPNALWGGAIPDPGLQRAYEERFCALLNYATLPFYWGAYEPAKDSPDEARLDAMADWCARNRVVAKGHPLAWHEFLPKWAEVLPDDEVLERLEARVRALVTRFAGRIDIWDVVNEATVSHRFENAVGRLIKREGAARVVDRALSWAHQANPRALLLYNDFNLSDDFEALAAALVEHRAPVHALGIQSHMHKGTWPLEKAWADCESYARFGLPLHFTELTILSGRPKAADDNDWHRVQPDWASTPAGEEAQLGYGSALCTLLFSHPAVEAITFWDFSDESAWQGAPAGLVRKDMSPKPLYEWLAESFGKRWATRERVVLDAAGRARVRAWFGEHRLMVKTPSGERLGASVAFRRRGQRKLRLSAE